MAQIVKRKNKNGSTSYLFRVSTGYDRNGKQVTTSRTFTPPPTLTGRKLEKEVRRRAVEFETGSAQRSCSRCRYEAG